VKVLHLNTYDVVGGAAIAAYRIHRALVAAGVDSRMLVMGKAGDDPLVMAPGSRFGRLLARIKPALEVQWTRLAARPRSPFSVNRFPELTLRRIRELDPDVVHLHWILYGFLRPESIAKLGKPIVWTLHDMWPVTGGCHYSGSCHAFEIRCGMCPLLGRPSATDLSAREWARKERCWRKLQLDVITPSHWLAGLVSRSALFRSRGVKVIPNTLDLSLFRPMDRDSTRRMLGLPVDRPLILFCSGNALNNPRKGLDLLEKATREPSLSQRVPGLSVVIVGVPPAGRLGGFGIPVISVDTIEDESKMAACYAATDLTVVPSREDNLPNTILESMACGRPCVGFRVGGIPEVIRQGETGWLAEPYEHTGLAEGIATLLGNRDLYADIARRCRQRVEEMCSPAVVARQYVAAYERVMVRKVEQERVWPVRPEAQIISTANRERR